ncbi:MAG: S-ribosylhomocysteine lyase, partial [Sulfurovaceae bacterium]
SDKKVVRAWSQSMKDILGVQSEKDIPELNIYQCGTYKMHSLKQAKKIAKKILKKGIGVMDNEALALDVKKSKRV